MGRLLTGALIGIVLIAPVISLIYLEHALFGHHYVPVEWVHSNLGLIATETLLGSESILITGPYFMAKGKKSHTPKTALTALTP